MKKMLILIGAIIIGVLVVVFAMNTSTTDKKETVVQTYTGGLYQDYDAEKIATVSGDIVLFFHANRCATCIQAEKSFLASGIPEGLHIFKVDFDTAKELRERYTVLSQTTFVYIDADANMIKRRIGARDIAGVLEMIQANQDISSEKKISDNPSDLREAYFAGGCFWCMEGPFEALDGVKEAVSGYLGGSASTADYEQVSQGTTKHREVVKVVYDPSIVSYQDLVDAYRRQIDPTDDGGQFADRGYQYTTAIYYSDEKEQEIAQTSKTELGQSAKFSKAIAVKILPVTDFFQAEDYHQDYYKTNSENYDRYKKGSGRYDFVKKTRTGNISSRKDRPVKTVEDLTDEQRRILFEGGTEPPFDNAYRDNKQAGIYVDVIDGTPLFSSTDKFDSGTGRPSFTRPIQDSFIDARTDLSHGMERTEIKSSSSDGHLGHIFQDGPASSGGTRYCINSAAIEFVPVEKLEELGYGEYLPLFN